MTLITFGSVQYDADLVAFDKDGTLTDFEFLWGRLTAAWLEKLSSDVGCETALGDLCGLMGYDFQRGRTAPESPLVQASEGQLQTIAAAVLYRCGVPWSEAVKRSSESFLEVMAAQPLPDLIGPLGNPVALFTKLRSIGVQVAVVTSDDRARTEQVLDILGLASLVDELACGDDGLPWKPAPDMLMWVCERLKVESERVAVVGDTLADLLMAKQAGAGLSVAVLTGMGAQAELTALADVVLRSIDEIDICQDVDAT